MSVYILTADFTIESFIFSSQHVRIWLDNKGQVHNGKQKQDHTLLVD